MKRGARKRGGVLLYAGFILLGAGKLLYCRGLLYVVIALASTALSHVLGGRASATVE